MILKIKNMFKHENRKRITLKTKHILFGMNTTDGLVFKLLIYVLLIIIGFIFIYPIIAMVSTSLMGIGDIADTSIKWIPSSLEFSNYKEAFSKLDIWNSFWKTIVVCLIPSIINVAVCSVTAYGFSKFNFPGKKILFIVMLATFIIPKKITGIPQYAWFSQMKLLGSLFTYILPALFGQGFYSALYILILYSTINLIPKQLEEAAKMDGATSVQVFLKVVIPLIIPSLITVFLFSFVWYWNDSAAAVMYLSKQGSGYWTTLLVELQQYQDEINAITSGGEGIKALLYRGSRMAATFISILPLLIVYFALQKYFVESVERSGITGE